LAKSSVSSLGFRGFAPTAPFLLFKLQHSGFAAEYQNAWKIADVFQQGSMGVVTARDHISIAFEDEPLLSTAAEFRDSSLSDEAVCEKLDIPKKKGWDVSKARALIRQERNLKSFVTDIGYRPFDTRRIFYHRSLVWGMSWPTMQHVLGKKNIGISTTRSIEAGNFQHIFASSSLIGHHFVSLKEVNYFFPLWVFPEKDSLAFHGDRAPNLKPEFLKATAQAMGLQQSGAHSLPVGLTPEDIFHYVYAVFHSPSYRSRYAEFLKIDFPRLPLTGDLELFHDLARLGEELTAMHLLESPKLDQPNTDFIGGRAPAVEKITWSKNTVWIDKAQTSGFRGVNEGIWNFRIGGYQVCEKWLKDRKDRKLTKDDIAHYQKVVVALSETTRLMQEIDAVIETRGGWPGAFATASIAVPPPTELSPAPGESVPTDLSLQTEDELPLG
jgi:predicted helicase